MYRLPRHHRPACGLPCCGHTASPVQFGTIRYYLQHCLWHYLILYANSICNIIWHYFFLTNIQPRVLFLLRIFSCFFYRLLFFLSPTRSFKLGFQPCPSPRWLGELMEGGDLVPLLLALGYRLFAPIGVAASLSHIRTWVEDYGYRLAIYTHCTSFICANQ